MAIGDKSENVELQPMPTRVGEKVSQVKNHLFFRKGAELAIVDPKDDKIVDVINEKIQQTALKPRRDPPRGARRRRAPRNKPAHPRARLQPRSAGSG